MLQRYRAARFGEAIHEWGMNARMLFTMPLTQEAMWGLLQQGLQNKGHVRCVEGFDFLKYANTTFEAIRQFLE